MIVTESRYTIKAPEQLRERLSDLCAISYYAKTLGLEDLSKQAKDIYFDISLQWDEQAKKDAKKKSSGWFARGIGGGVYYRVDSANKWKNDSFMWETVSKVMSISDIQKELKSLLEKMKR